jgi:PRTRC genetic system protein D
MTNARIAIDVGCGHTKMAFRTEDNGVVIYKSFPSILLPEYLYQKTQWHPRELKLVESGETNNFLTGEDIFEAADSGFILPDLNEQYSLSDTYRQFVYAALKRQPHDEIRTLVLSLPLLTFASYRDALMSNFTGLLKVSIDRHVFVESVVVRPQGVAAAQNEVDVKEHRNVVGFDLGSFTLDIFKIVEGEFEKSSCESIALGMTGLVKEIISNIRSSASITFNEKIMLKIRTALVTGEAIRLGEQHYSLTKLLEIAPISTRQ